MRRTHRLAPSYTERQVADCGKTPEQALVEEIVVAMRLTAEGWPVAAGSGQDDPVGLSHLPGCKAAAVTGRDNDDRRHRGASARQRLGELLGAERPVRTREPQTGAALAVRRQEDQASVARLCRQVCDPLQQSIGTGRLHTRCELLGACAQAVDVACRDTRRHEAPVHFVDRIVEDRLRIIAGGEHHLPAPGGASRARLCETVANERAEDRHEAGRPDRGPQQHQPAPSEEASAACAASRAILAKIEEIT
jgi:hypothetical protein